MFINGLSTAAPSTRYTQRECWEALQGAEPFMRLNSRSQALLRKVLLGDNGIASRHMALEPLREAMNLTPDALQQRFARHAPALAAQAAPRAPKGGAAGPCPPAPRPSPCWAPNAAALCYRSASKCAARPSTWTTTRECW